MKKKKNRVEVEAPIITDLGNAYYTLWQKLNRLHEERDIDQTRREMSQVWSQMKSIDKEAFQQLSRRQQ